MKHCTQHSNGKRRTYLAWKCGCNLVYVIFKTHVNETYIKHLLQNRHQANDTWLQWWLVNTCSGNGLVQSVNEPLPEPTLTKLYDAMWHHYTTMSSDLELHNMLLISHPKNAACWGYFLRKLTMLKQHSAIQTFPQWCFSNHMQEVQPKYVVVFWIVTLHLEAVFFLYMMNMSAAVIVHIAGLVVNYVSQTHLCWRYHSSPLSQRYDLHWSSHFVAERTIGSHLCEEHLSSQATGRMAGRGGDFHIGCRHPNSWDGNSCDLSKKSSFLH